MLRCVNAAAFDAANEEEQGHELQHPGHDVQRRWQSSEALLSATAACIDTDGCHAPVAKDNCRQSHRPQQIGVPVSPGHTVAPIEDRRAVAGFCVRGGEAEAEDVATTTATPVPASQGSAGSDSGGPYRCRQLLAATAPL